MGAAGVEAQLAVAGVGVGGIGDHGAAVGCAAAGDEDIGAGMALPHGEGKQQQGKEGSFGVHGVKRLINNDFGGAQKTAPRCKDTFFF